VVGGLRKSAYVSRVMPISTVVTTGLRKSGYYNGTSVVSGLRKSAYRTGTTSTVLANVRTSTGLGNVAKKSGYNPVGSKWEIRKSNYSSKSGAMSKSNYIRDVGFGGNFGDLKQSSVQSRRIVSEYDVDSAVDRIINKTLYN
jgi:hypothetical protein